MRTSKFITATAFISAVMLLSSGFAVAGPPQDPRSNGNGPEALGVERYQVTDFTINVASVNGNTSFMHTFEVRHDPCSDTYSGSGSTGGRTETLSEFDMVGNTLSFRADYDFASYTWFPSFTLNEAGTLAFVDGYGEDNVTVATGTWTSQATSYKNHGQYVAASVDQYGPDAESCNGMPIVSNGKTG